VGVPTIKLLHGAEIPAIGLGTYGLFEDEGVVEIRNAIQSGYRLIDTAENYGNEAQVGQAIKEAGIPREDLFITSKFNRKWHSVTGVQQAWENSIRKLGVDYIDLYLIHWPNPDQDKYIEAWQGLTTLLQQGKVKAIGMSNFKPAHLERVIGETGVVPDVNQIELNPYLQRKAAVDYHKKHGILTEAWSPLKPNNIVEHPVITEIAKAKGVTPAQVILRWDVQKGIVPIPKSANPQRQRSNLDVFSFALDDADLAALNALDQGEAGAADSDTFGH
jgi:2,5-diketo-D-gluconate reductase A